LLPLLELLSLFKDNTRKTLVRIGICSILVLAIIPDLEAPESNSPVKPLRREQLHGELQEATAPPYYWRKLDSGKIRVDFRETSLGNLVSIRNKTGCAGLVTVLRLRIKMAFAIHESRI